MKNDKYGKTSLILGIVSLFPTGIPGLICAGLGLYYSSKQKRIAYTKNAKWGMILSIIGIAIGVVAFIGSIFMSLIFAMMAAAGY
ncbi:hypothetical protein KY316_03305 [Candidatus Woesearchaeota archaeon]|nr:hypothetical protein [Candidatus Woesearchaeota archaeon]